MSSGLDSNSCCWDVFVFMVSVCLSVRSHISQRPRVQTLGLPNFRHTLPVVATPWSLFDGNCYAYPHKRRHSRQKPSQELKGKILLATFVAEYTC